MSDLLPETKNITQMDLDNTYEEDLRLLRARRRLYMQNLMTGFVTDRSYIDGMAYHLHRAVKHSSNSSRDFLGTSLLYLLRDFDMVFFLNFTFDMAKNWPVEWNNKRCTNSYFQWGMSSLMFHSIVEMLNNLDEPSIYPRAFTAIWGYFPSTCPPQEYEVWGLELRNINTGKTFYLFSIEENDLEKRQFIITELVKKYKK
jgi:hypothetical protein